MNLEKNNIIEPFIVENAINTCYIDSLLMALFYSPSVIENLLNNDPKNGTAIYLQEYVKFNFINQIRNNKSILEDTVNMIRTICIQLGWKNNTNNTEEYFEQQDITEFFIFLLDLFNGPTIEIQRKTITDTFSDEIEIGTIEKIPFIPLLIPDNVKETSIKDMLHNWLYDNHSEIKKLIYTDKGQVEQVVSGLNIYNIVNIPYMICLNINRFKGGTNIRDNTDVIIQKKINPLTNSIYKLQNDWIFHAVICHHGDSLKNGHYYTVLFHNNKYYLFDDQQIPSLVEVSMSDNTLTNSIKKECVFVIYKIN